MDDEYKIACCVICLVSPNLRVCNECPFRVGLAFRAIREAEQGQAPSESVRAEFIMAMRETV